MVKNRPSPALRDRLNPRICDRIATIFGTAAVAALVFSTPARAEEAKQPTRIVAAGGAVTEILYALGAQNRIAGVDTTSLYPPEVRSKPNVGYVRQLSAEGVLSLQPDLVIAQEGAGPPDTVKLIEQAGVKVARVTDTPTEAGVLERITSVGSLSGENGKAKALAEDVKQQFAKVAALRGKVGEPLKALFILSLQNGRPLVAGRNTGADGMITLAGAKNVGTAFEGYKPMTEEAIIAAAPDVVVMMERPGNPLSAADIFGNAALAATPAGENKRLVAMDGLYLLGYGPRTPDAARDLLLAFYPKLATTPEAAAAGAK